MQKYSTAKYGPDHAPHFAASLTVNDQVFYTPVLCKSSKVAQNTCAQISFDHLNAYSSPRQVHRPTGSISSPATATLQVVRPYSPSPTVPPAYPRPKMQPTPLPTPSPRLLMSKNANARPVNSEIVQQNCKETTQTSMLYRAAKGSHNTLHMYKNQLQQYCQKKNFDHPVYTTVAEGPPHSCRFKSSVVVRVKTYETLEFFTTLKEAEQAAARVAFQMLKVDAAQEDGGLYKNLLQELAQEKGLLPPMYESVISGLSHSPSFLSTVKVGSHIVQGAEAKTKKLAEVNAAKAAYRALTEGK